MSSSANTPLPAYTGQDLNTYKLLIVRSVAARLGIAKAASADEHETMNRIRTLKPEAPALIESTIQAYGDLASLTEGGAGQTLLEKLQQDADHALQVLESSLS
jgi:hypothetical protein